MSYHATAIHAFKVAGVRFHNYKDANLTVGDALTAEPEPENPYDPNAIKVLKDGIMIGHVPRTDTEIIHKALPDKPNFTVSYLDLAGKYPVIVVQVTAGETLDGSTYRI